MRIALAAEQAVQAVNWAEKVEVSRRAIRAEVSRDARYYAFRVAAAPCVERRLNDLAKIIEDVARGKPVAPVRFSPSLGRP